MTRKPELKPTPDQTFEWEVTAGFDFYKTLSESRRLDAAGRVEEACNMRFHAFQSMAEVLPEDEEIVLEWNHRNSRAALELIFASAIDHFLIDDFEMSAAMLELLLELDPEDHLEASEQLAFDYSAMGEEDSFDAVIDDVPEKSAARAILLLWAAFRRSGAIPTEELRAFRQRYAPWYVEFTAVEHPADEAFVRAIESEHPSQAAQARELWLQTENLWRRWPEFIDALK